MTITIESTGRRHYLIGNTYPIKDQLRAAGAKWDPERKAWWTGKRETAESIVAGAPSQPAPASGESTGSSDGSRQGPGESGIVAGRAAYKGRTYYLAGRVERGRTHYDDRVSAVSTRDGSKYLLLFRDGSSQFWAARGEVQIVKTYDRPTTIGKLKHFAERAKQARAEGNEDGIANGQRYECEECGEYVTRGVGSCWETGHAH